MMKYDTYVCNVCKKAEDVLATTSGLSALPRCNITRNCTGILTMADRQSVTDVQYHVDASADVYVKQPLIYDHQQTASRRVWTINHNLGASATISIMVRSSTGELAPLYDFDVVSETNATAVLDLRSTYTGIALVSARQSGYSTKVAYAAVLANIPVSINNTMVIATLDPTADSIELSVQPNPLRPSDIVHLAVSAIPTTTTPWVGTSYVVISNQRYFVKYVNISDVLLFHRAAANFFVNLFDDKPVERGTAYVLLSDEPYKHASDRNFAQAVDLMDLAITNQSNTLLTQTALLCTPSALSTIYPTMKVA